MPGMPSLYNLTQLNQIKISNRLQTKPNESSTKHKNKKTKSKLDKRNNPDNSGSEVGERGVWVTGILSEHMLHWDCRLKVRALSLSLSLSLCLSVSLSHAHTHILSVSHSLCLSCRCISGDIYIYKQVSCNTRCYMSQ